jgi:N-sulfoglucosamine sulfohydrolase
MMCHSMPAIARGASRVIAVIAAFAFGGGGAGQPTVAAERPNVLWISAEDISASTVGCYGGPARTPRIDALAAAGVRFDDAFSAAPVCAPSRSAIITGVMPTTLGSLPMRCRATPPAHVVGFPKLLREAGYYCTNASKTDYNLAAGFDAGWHDSSPKAHWRKRPDPTQPFFAVFNFTVTHESGLFHEKLARARTSLAADDRRDPAEIHVPPYYPDTPVVREALAGRLELAALLDRDVGRVLDELAADGLADDTIVFFWGDHGEGIAHGKRALNEHGLRVPLVVHVPTRFAERATLPGGGPPVGVTGELVNLLDLGPTVLDLAGVPIPDWMEGHSFLGPHARAAAAVIGVRDRMDAFAGFGRSVREARFRYVRNFLPWLDGDDLPPYADGVPITGQLRAARAAGTLPAGGGWFSRTTRPVEELYDIVADPDEIRDLAGEANHAGDLQRLRGRLRAWMRETRDTGILPEPLLRREARAAGSEWAIFHPAASGTAADLAAAARYDRLLDVAWDVAEDRTGGHFAPRLEDPDPAVRFWAACGVGWAAVRSGNREASTAAARLEPLLADPDPVVRIAAARWLVACDAVEPGVEALNELIAADDPEVRFAALSAVDQLGLAGRPLWPRVVQMALGKDERYARDVVERIRGWLDRGTTHRGH